MRYGIITPYTSFLIEEDDIAGGECQEGSEKAAEEFLALPTAPASARRPRRQADVAGAPARGESAGGGPLPEAAAQVVRVVGQQDLHPAERRVDRHGFRPVPDEHDPGRLWLRGVL